MLYIMKYSLMVLILSSEIDCDHPKRLQDFSYIYLMVISPQYVPNQRNRRLCTAIMLVEDIFYLTAKNCFDSVAHHQSVKIAMIQKEKPLFDLLVYEQFFMKTKDLDTFVVLRKDDITLDIERRGAEPNKDPTNKDPYHTDTLIKPRVLLALPDSPSFTHCYCLGWGSYARNPQDFSNLELKLTSSKVHSTKMNKLQVLVEREEGKDVEDYGSPLLCEVRKNGELIASAVVGTFMGGDDKLDSMEYGVVTYGSFIGKLEKLTRWAIGTNVSVTGNLSDWTLWPTVHLPTDNIGDNVKTKSSANCLSKYKFMQEFGGSIFLIAFFSEYNN